VSKVTGKFMKNLKFILLALVHLVFLANSAQAHYDPNIGRWLSRDPIAERGGVNLYGMCENNTIWKFDSNGKSPRFSNEPSQPNDPETCKVDPSFNKAMEELKKELEQDKLKKATAATHTCCSDAKIIEGKKKLLDQYDKFDKATKPSTPPGGGWWNWHANDSCQNVNFQLGVNLTVPACWECTMTHREPGVGTTFIDHWWVTCNATGSDGTNSDKLILDYWRQYTGSDDSEYWRKWPFIGEIGPGEEPKWYHDPNDPTF